MKLSLLALVALCLVVVYTPHVQPKAWLGPDGIWYGKVCSTGNGSCFTNGWLPVGARCVCFDSRGNAWGGTITE